MKYSIVIFLLFTSLFCFSQSVKSVRGKSDTATVHIVADTVNFKTDSVIILQVLGDLDAFFRKNMSYDGYVQGSFAGWLNQYYIAKQKEFIKPKSK